MPNIPLNNQAQTIEITERTNRDYLRFVPQKENLYQKFGEGFLNHNLSEAERNAKKNDTRSDLYKKRANARLLNKRVDQLQHRKRVLMQEQMADRPVQCPDDTYRDISSFMTSSNTAINKEILDCYFGRPNQQNPQQMEGQNVQKALGIMVLALLRTDISQMHLDNDEQIAKNAHVLEQLSEQVGALDRLLEKHPEFTEGWTEGKKTLLRKRMAPLRAIALYYQTRKSIMNDPYYQDHFDDELSMEIRTEDSLEQQALAKKLVQSYVFENEMIRTGTVQNPRNLVQTSAVTLTNGISRQYLLTLKEACINRQPQYQKGILHNLRMSVNDASYRQKAKNEHKVLFRKAAEKNISFRDRFLVHNYVHMQSEWRHRHLTDDRLRGRTIKVVSCMAYLRKDDESTSLSMFDSLLLKTDGEKTDIKIKKARIYETLFDFIRNYDLKKFEYPTAEAAFQTRYLKPYAMGYMMRSLPKEYFDDYFKLMKDPKAECALKPDEVYEVMARWAAIRSASSGNLPPGTAFDTLLQPERAKLQLDEADRIRNTQRNQLEIRRQQLMAEKQQAAGHADEMANIQQNMDHVQERGFVTVQRPPHRIGLLGKIRNLALMGIRGIVRGITSMIGGTGISQTYPATMAAYNWAKSDTIEHAQRKRRHDMVPGKEMEFFDDEESVAKDEQGEDLEVYSDVRRGPLVWEKMTAGDPNDPPEVCIMTEQPVRGSEKAIGGEGHRQGHALITLSYSRYSKLTKRKERYQLRMGFYPKGGIGIQSKGSMFAGAYLGGGLESDDLHGYDVSRRYVVKPGDINKILKKAETYADGGYNLFKRNCSTFVIDMAREINLPLEEIYKEEQPQLETLHQAAMEAGVGVADLTQLGGAADIISRLDKNDLSYHNFGQKMYTKEDLNRFYQTFDTGDFFKSGYNPGLLGEDLRKAKSGILSARFESNMGMDRATLLKRQEDLATLIWEKIERIVPVAERNDKEEEMQALLLITKDAGYFKEEDKGEAATAENFRDIHRRLRNVITKISLYFTERLSSDNRLNDNIIEYLSILEVLQTKTDCAYRKILRKEVKGNTGKLQYDFYENKYTLAYKKGEILTTTELTPALYEGFLTAGYTPEQIATTQKKYDDLIELGNHRTDAQNKELKNLKRLRRLAVDFASASRYLMEKEDYTDQDLRYAFRDLPEKELKVTAVGDEIQGDLQDRENRPSYYYQCVMLDKVLFGDFRSLNLHGAQTNIDAKRAALDAYMQERLNANGNRIRAVLRYYIEGREDPAGTIASSLFMDYALKFLENAYRGIEVIPGTWEGVATALTVHSVTIQRLTEMIEQLRAEQQQQQQQQ